MIHLRVVSPPDITDALVPELRAEPAVMNLAVLRSAVGKPAGDVVQFDVLQGAADDVISRLRVLTAVALAGLPAQRAIWRRSRGPTGRGG
ncbi:hypothetical protein [Georgenia ruanii]|uniref:hypothetical protein n=1 Tax=Georgenia ruanii TaxID=348442 RepID=UPI0012653D3E|nr:hypothetical protein [Georgenia ruanii]